MFFAMMFGGTPFYTIAFTFYTYIYIPFLQISNSTLRILTFLVNPHNQGEINRFEETPVVLDLPISSFQDLGRNSRGDPSNEGEVCSICLMEFEENDLVNKLPRCGHVFHMECIEKWLDRCQFTCPLCRSLLLHQVTPSPCKMWCSGFTNYNPDHDS